MQAALNFLKNHVSMPLLFSYPRMARNCAILIFKCINFVQKGRYTWNVRFNLYLTHEDKFQIITKSF